MFAGGHYSQVLKSIIESIAIDVMDHVSFRNRAVSLFPDKSVFQVLLSPVRDPKVSFSSDVTPSGMAAQLPFAHSSPCFGGMPVAKYRLSRLFAVFGLRKLPECRLSYLLSALRRVLAAKPVLGAKFGLAHLRTGFKRVFAAEKVLVAKSILVTKHSLREFLSCLGRALSTSHLTRNYNTNCIWGAI